MSDPTDFVMIDGRRLACLTLPDGRLAILVAADPAFFGIAPPDWQAVATATIAATGTFQELFPAGEARHGGYIVNTSDPGSAPLLVDPTGAGGDPLSAVRTRLPPDPSKGATHV